MNKNQGKSYHVVVQGDVKGPVAVGENISQQQQTTSQSSGVDNSLDSQNSETLNELWQKISNSFNLAELRGLCLQLGTIDFEDLSGEGKREKIQQLVLYFDRRDELEDLTAVCAHLRPKIPW